MSYESHRDRRIRLARQKLDEELKDLMIYLIGYSTEYIAGVYQEGVDMGLDGEPRWSIETVNNLIGS